MSKVESTLTALLCGVPLLIMRMTQVPQAHQELVTSDMHRPLRCPLPDQLTPAHVHALLSDLRLSASQVNTCRVKRRPFYVKHMPWVHTPGCCLTHAVVCHVLLCAPC